MVSNLSRRELLSDIAGTIVGGTVALGMLPKVYADSILLPTNSSDQRIWCGEYWAKKGSASLYMYRKRLGAPHPGESPLPILFLAHGSSVSSRPTFDLSVPGHGEYSLMDKFAQYGFDVWTMDFEGYGRSSHTAGNSDVASGVGDLKAASLAIERETGQKRFHLYGESGGALRAGAFAMAFPEHIRRLILVAFVWTGKGSPTLMKRSQQIEFYKTHNRRPRSRSMILSIFTRDKPGTSDPAVGEAMADAAMKFGDTVPTGTYLDMTTKLPIIDPLKLLVPVLIVRGEFDGIATEQDLLNFFEKLTVGDRQFNVIPGASHSIALGNNRAQLWHIMRAFLDIPSGTSNPVR